MADSPLESNSSSLWAQHAPKKCPLVNHYCRIPSANYIPTEKKTLCSIGTSRNYAKMGHLYHSYICQWYSHVKSPKAMSSEKHDCLVVSTPLKNMKVSWDDYSQYMEKYSSCSKPPTRCFFWDADAPAGLELHWKSLPGRLDLRSWANTEWPWAMTSNGKTWCIMYMI
jgi:hypothetical protein